MSRRLKTRGKKSFKKRVKHITLKKKNKSRRKRNTKSKRKRNTKSKRKRNTKSKNKKKKGGEPGGERDNAYTWNRENTVMKGFVLSIDEDYVYVKTQIGEDGPFEVIAFEPSEFEALDKTELGSDDTKNLKRKAIERQQEEDDRLRAFDDDDDNDNDNSDRSRDDDDTIASTESLTQSQIDAWNREGAEQAEFPIASDDENDNNNSDNISVGTASTRDFLEGLDLGSDTDTED